jgi:hypothetical protein
MTIFCPRCGAHCNQEARECKACAFPLVEVSAIVAGGGKSRYWRRIAITFLIFIGAPLFLLKIGERVNKDFYEFLAGFLLVLLLPGLPWILAAIFNRPSKLN